ncbi:GGDEF domain-containing protein [Sulfurimonas sp.]
MKHSIKDIFQNLSTYLFFVFFLAFLALMLILEQQLSFQKTDILKKEKQIILDLVNQDKRDLDIALIQFNAKSTQLLQYQEQLKIIYKYNIFEQFIIKNSTQYLNDLSILSSYINKFDNATHKFYLQNKDKSLEKDAKQNLDTAFNEVNQHINSMLLKTIGYNQEKFDLVKYIVVVSFILIFLATFWYRKILNSIYGDISYLFKFEKSKSQYDMFSLEADAIALRMNRKSSVSDNPNLIDPVTGINNYKGLVHSYSHKKSLKDSNFTSVTILEIDNFSKSKRLFPQEIAQAMLKKVAYTISLHEQPVDVIARTDYNQFTIILSRASKEQSFKEVDLIRAGISELKFNIPETGPVNITVSGGFIVKPNNTSLEEALRQAKEILHYAKSIGKNNLLQLKDLARKEI